MLEAFKYFSSNYAFCSFPFLFPILFFKYTHIGDAIQIEEYAPLIIPTINGNVNCLTDGTRKFNAIIVITVASDVYNDLAIVSVILTSATSIDFALLIIFVFSLILSKITIVSHIEYPTIVSIAAINGVFTGTLNTA